MTDIKISALTELAHGSVTNNDVIPIVDDSATETKKVKIKDLIEGLLPSSSYSDGFSSRWECSSTSGGSVTLGYCSFNSASSTSVTQIKLSNLSGDGYADLLDMIQDASAIKLITPDGKSAYYEVTAYPSSGTFTVAEKNGDTITLSATTDYVFAFFGSRSAGGGSGDITSVTAGSGLTGGGTSGDVTLNIGGSDTINVGTSSIAVEQGSIEADHLAVIGDGTTTQFLRSDGDGTFTWATPPSSGGGLGAGDGLTDDGTDMNVGGSDTIAVNTDDIEVKNYGLTPIKLDANNSPTAGRFLIYNSASSNFDWALLTGTEGISFVSTSTTEKSIQITDDSIDDSKLNAGSGSSGDVLTKGSGDTVTWETPSSGSGINKNSFSILADGTTTEWDLVTTNNARVVVSVFYGSTGETLPIDGSKVWINEGTTTTYPSIEFSVAPINGTVYRIDLIYWTN